MSAQTDLSSIAISSGYVQLLHTGDTSGIEADATAHYITDGNGTASALSISTSRVGIGTAAPGNQLSVQVADVSADIAIDVSNDANRFIKIGIGNTSDAKIAWDNADRLVFGQLANTDSAWSTLDEKMRIDASGNVGIGTADNDNLLTVSASSDPIIALVSGTSSAEQNIGNGFDIGSIYFRGYDGGEYDGIQTGAFILAEASSTWDEDDVHDAPTALKFFTQGGGTSDALGNPRMVIASEGNVTVSTGNLVIGTADKGISFTGGTDPDTTGTATGNILDDYEEGTWTASFTTDETAPTTVRTATGYYIKIGGQVTISAGTSSIDMRGSSGNLRITGMPFDAGTADFSFGACYFMNFDIPSGAMSICVALYAGQPMRFLSTHDNTNYQQIEDNSTYSGRCYFSITYQV